MRFKETQGRKSDRARYVCGGLGFGFGDNFNPPWNFVLEEWEGITDALAEVNVVGRR